MEVRRFVIAVAAAAAVILSAPFAQQAFTELSTRWPRQFRAFAISATAVPAAAAFLFALVRIRERRTPRYLALALAAAISAGYIVMTGLSFTESFHFVEYGVVAMLFYRAWRPLEDGSVVLLPMLAGALAGTLDEWFQWFIPIRAGEARDVGLNTIAIGCGLLVAIAIDPPARPGLTLRRESLPRVGAWAAALVVTFAFFFQFVHLGYDVMDKDGGSFRSHYTATSLWAASSERAHRWRDRPPLVQRRIGREDQYMAEGLWHVQRRNRTWDAGDAFTAWRENRILETFFAPVLDTPSFASATGHRWPAGQRTDAEARAAGDRGRYISTAEPFPVYAWPKPLFWTAHFLLLAVISVLCRRYSS